MKNMCAVLNCAPDVTGNIHEARPVHSTLLPHMNTVAASTVHVHLSVSPTTSIRLANSSHHSHSTHQASHVPHLFEQTKLLYLKPLSPSGNLRISEPFRYKTGLHRSLDSFLIPWYYLIIHSISRKAIQNCPHVLKRPATMFAPPKPCHIFPISLAISRAHLTTHISFLKPHPLSKSS